MKIFFYSTVFAPSVGGIETLVETLCRQFVALGHEVMLATETPGQPDMPFGVVRRPTIRQMRKLLAWCDVHVQANVSLKSAWVLLLAPKKSFYQHNNVYQRDDGKKRVVDRLKTTLARTTRGIANSSYTAERTGAKHIILNAYDDIIFRPPPNWMNKERDLVFLGRLVSQKGCETLIEALRLLAGSGRHPNLTVIGDGPERSVLEQRAVAAGISGQVLFLGTIKGRPLATELARHRVIVVPSKYEEPFGIVALEGMACGCIPIVSERGGLTDAIGPHGFTFPNGDAVVLAETLDTVLSDMDAARKRLCGVEEHLARCSARSVAEHYIAAFEQDLKCTA